MNICRAASPKILSGAHHLVGDVSDLLAGKQPNSTSVSVLITETAKLKEKHNRRPPTSIVAVSRHLPPLDLLLQPLVI